MVDNCVSSIGFLSIAVQIIIDVFLTLLFSVPILATEVYRIFSPKCKEVKGKLVLVNFLQTIPVQRH